MNWGARKTLWRNWNIILEFALSDWENLRKTSVNIRGFHGGDYEDAVFWGVAPCRYFVNRRFGGTYHLYLRGIRNPLAMNQREQVAIDSATCSRWFIARGFLIPWKWRPYVPPKRRLTKYLHGATSQRTAFFDLSEVFQCLGRDRIGHITSTSPKLYRLNWIAQFIRVHDVTSYLLQCDYFRRWLSTSTVLNLTCLVDGEVGYWVYKPRKQLKVNRDTGSRTHVNKILNIIEHSSPC
jgi:hypothetical protein